MDINVYFLPCFSFVFHSVYSSGTDRQKKNAFFFLYFTAPVTFSAPKSSYHLKLEDELLENKRAIFKILSTNSNVLLLKNLRDQTTTIMRTLTAEIRREAIEQRTQGKN